jgi:hypothetical protein
MVVTTNNEKQNVFNENRLIICDSNLIEFVLIEIIKDDWNELLMWQFFGLN